MLYMKNLIFCIIGILIIVVAVIAPFPPVLWKVFICMAGCFLIVFGLKGRKDRKNGI